MESSRVGRRIAHAVVAGVTLAVVLAAAAAAGAYTFGEPEVRAAGPEVTVYDWTTQRCDSDDIPDQPSRAFRNSAGQVVFINAHHTTRRWAGSSLAAIAHSCSILMGSGKNSDPSKYDNREWLATTWTTDGSKVHGLIHAEYQGWQYGPGYCIRPGELFEDKRKCWYNALTLTTSTDGGSRFSHATPPAHYVAGPPYRYEPGIGPIGFFQPSNIVRGRDGWHYLVTHTEGHGVQPTGSCLLRSSRLDDPASWRAWDGFGFNRRFRDPYLYEYEPAEGVCTPISPSRVGTRSESLTWSTYLKQWVLVGSADGASGPGFYYYTSDDLINWSAGRLLMQAELPWTHECQDGPEQVRDPSLLDDESQSRNFDTIGQRPYLFFTRFNVQFNTSGGCFTNLDRDLIRIPLEFSNQEPGGPSAALTASSPAPDTGEPVRFDASRSADADGSIVRYEWDLDGDGAYERETGGSPVAEKAYAEPGPVTVTVRVFDDAGKHTDETVFLVVGREDRRPAQPAPGAGAPGGLSAPAPTARAAPSARMAAARRARGTSARGALVRVKVPSAGTLHVRPVARRRVLRQARRPVAAAGLVSLRVRPSRAGRRVIARRGRLRVRMLVAFTPVGGATQTAKVSVTLRHQP